MMSDSFQQPNCWWRLWIEGLDQTVCHACIPPHQPSKLFGKDALGTAVQWADPFPNQKVERESLSNTSEVCNSAGVSAVHARTCCSASGTRDHRCGRRQVDGQSLRAPLNPINGERWRECKKRCDIHQSTSRLHL